VQIDSGAYTRAALTAPGPLDKQKSFALSARAALFMMALISRPLLLLQQKQGAKDREKRGSRYIPYTALCVCERAACSLNQSTQTFNDFALLWHSLINSRIQAAAKG
jgi:hypothetical protein